MSYVYILICRDNTLYTGWTVDLVKRIKTHNTGKASKYTRSRLPAKLIYFEEFDNKIDAQKREYAIKQLTKQKKLELIESFEVSSHLQNDPCIL